MKKLKSYIVPGTKLGRMTSYLFFGFWFFFAIFRGFVLSGYRGGEGFFDNPALAIPISLAGLCGGVSFFTGLVSMIFKKERSAFVFVCALWGLFVLVFISGEILTPH